MTTSQMHGRARVEKTTTELVRGERIELCNGLLPTIGAIRHTGYENARRVGIWGSWYQEPATNKWGEGNSWTADQVWELGEDEIYRQVPCIESAGGS